MPEAGVAMEVDNGVTYDFMLQIKFIILQNYEFKDFVHACRCLPPPICVVTTREKLI